MRTIIAKTKVEKRARLHRKIRSKISGTATTPRLAVYRSNRFISAQLIDDVAQKTIVSATDMKSASKEGKIVSAQNVGKAVAELALKAKVTKVVFDRGGFSYTGRVKALADGAREGGLQF